MSTEAEDGWNWPWLLYMGKKHLNMTEEEFWRTTPRKFHALILAHAETISGERKKEEKSSLGFIDQVENW